MNLNKRQLIISALLTTVFLLWPLSRVLASTTTGMPSVNGLENKGEGYFSVDTKGGVDMIVNCGENLRALGTPSTSADIAALIVCLTTAATKQNMVVNEGVISQLQALEKKQAREEWLANMQKQARETLAAAFRASLKSFAQQTVHDTAVWIASGGKGQKPLFITEGWGAYVKNAGDAALGEFIDGIGTEFGMDLCQPNFQVKLAIKVGLDYTQPKKVRCTFTQIMTNWQSAINNASFALDYKDSFRPGANDVSYALIMADRSMSYTATAKQDAAKEAEIPGLWKNIKNIAGQILTPGSMIADAMREAAKGSSLGIETFTNTSADIIEEFVNTLVAELLKNLQNGYFADSSGGSNNKGNLPNLSGLSALFNPNSSPIINGAIGAQNKYDKLIDSKNKIGGNIDILLKLAQCSDGAKANPSPTDCVIDQKLLEAIRKKAYVTDLPGEVKNRIFVPQLNQVASLENNIPYRSILILRKYRIVPVGWEFAAQKIKASAVYKNYTLNDLMNCFYGKDINGCGTDEFKGLVDPYWVLKAPETFCRRLGFTAYNSQKNDQADKITRNEGCVDEQQCLQEDNKGNCLDYGNCTEERRVWKIGQECATRFNTCTTYTSRLGPKSSFLTNTLDFADCSTQTVGCRSFATNFNYQSKLWNGDVISATGVTRFSEFLASSIIATTPDIGWRIKEGHTISDNRRLSLGSACSKSSCDKIIGCQWNEAGKFCTQTASCEVPAGGISCYADSCYETNNLLSLKNPNFEDQETGINAGNAKFWTDELSYSNINNRHYRAVGQGQTGFGLKIISANNSADLITSLPEIALEAGKTYKLKFSIKGTIVQGSAIVAMIAGDSPYNIPNASVALGGQSLVGNANSWTNVEVPIVNTGNYSMGTIVIVTPIGTVADIALDNFQLYQLKPECSAAGVQLFSASTDQSQTAPSNIYFDRDVQACSADAVGCSQFIRTKADLGNNLLYNGGLEYGLAGWVSQLNPLPEVAQGVATIKKTNSVNYALLEVEPNSYYAFGYDAAKADTNVDFSSLTIIAYNTPTVASRQTIQPAETNCQIAGANSVKLPNNPAGYAFERKTCYFKAPSDTHYIKFAILPTYEKIKVDNLKIEKVSYPNFAATAYSIYDPSISHTVSQVAYINQAPDYFGCYKNEGGVWPTTAFELNGILAKRAPECNNFADVCMASEVGCELYKPINGDPEIPGVVDGLDLCPGECSGYQVYKQEATNFIASANFRQFIADKKAKYCSAAYAGCDEFTNLDEIGQGAEKKEYYVNFKTCQRPSADDASYYAWEGSDITGYQLKAFRLKKSSVLDLENGNNGFAPCTNLFYNADGSNVCQDPAANIANATKYDTFGICAKDDMPSNSDCRELYDTDGNVHYRLLSKTVTVSDNCHPYRRTQTQTTVATAQTDCQSTHGWWKEATKECIYLAIPAEGKVCSAEVAGCRAYTGNRGNNVRNVLSSSDFASATTSDNSWVDGNAKKDGIMISAEATYPGGNSLTNKIDAIDGSGINNNIIKHQVRLLKNHTYTLSFWAKGNQSFNPDNILFVSNDTNKDVFSAAKLAGENLLSPRVLITADWKRYDLGPVFITWEPTDNDYLTFILPGGAKIYLDNIILKELNNNIYAIENSWFTPVACDNKLDDSDGKKAIASNSCQDSSTSRCSVGEMLGCTAYQDRVNAVWYLRSFNSLCRRQAVGCEALISTHNSESALAETFNTGDDSEALIGEQEYDQIKVPADNLVYLVNDGTNTCSAGNKGCNAFGLPLVDKWDAIVGYQTVFLKNNPTRYQTDLCGHQNLWCEEYASANSLSYFKNPHGKTCDYVSNSGATGWYKTGTQEVCIPSEFTGTAFNGGGPNMSFGTGYEPATEKIQPFGPYADVLGDVTNGLDNRLNSQDNLKGSYAGWVGNCPTAADSCSEYVDPYSVIYNNFIPYDDVSSDGKVMVTLDRFALYNLENVTISGVQPAKACSGNWNYSFGQKSNLYYIKGNESEGTCQLAIEGIDTVKRTSKISKTGVYYALANSVDKTSCNGMVDFKSGCILMNSRNSIDYSKTSTPDRVLKYLLYDSSKTYLNNNLTTGLSNPSSPQMADASKQADANIIVKATADRTCAKWLECTTYEKASTSTAENSFNIKATDKCLNFSVCDFRNLDGSCYRYLPSSSKEVTSTNFQQNMTGYTIPNMLPVASMDQYGNSASVPNGNFESIISSPLPAEPLGWTMSSKAADLNNDGWKAYKYAVEGNSLFRKFDIGYLVVNGVYDAISDPIDVEKGAYVFDAWVNTQDLKSENVKARIFITSEIINSGNTEAYNNIKVNYDTGKTFVIMDGKKWLTTDSLVLKSGLPWTEKTLLLTMNQPDVIQIKLMNFGDEVALQEHRNTIKQFNDPDPSFAHPYDISKAPNYSNCYDLVLDAKGVGKVGKPNYETACNMGDMTLFDNISLKAALRTNNATGNVLYSSANLPKTNELIARGCRAYPAQDARSCQYVSDGNFFYGWYGYCLMEDPDNAGQCLQWYPIDELKGDVVDEYSKGYSDQSPLYYCAETKINKVRAVARDIGGGVSMSVMGGIFADMPGISNVVDQLLGEQIKFVGFKLSDPAVHHLFRYPIIQRFGAMAGILGGGMEGNNFGVGGGGFLGTMEKYYSCLAAKPGENACRHNTLDSESRAAIAAALSSVNPAEQTDCSALDLLPRISCSYNQTVRDAINPIIATAASIIESTTGVNIRLGQHLSQNSVWGGWGAIVPVIMKGGDMWIGLVLPISSWDYVEEKLTAGSGSGGFFSQIFDKLGINDILGEGSVLGAKIVTDEDQKYAGKFKDQNSTEVGDILGIVWGVVFGDKAGLHASGISVAQNFNANYCTKVVQVVTPIGQNKAWTSRVQQASQFTFLPADKEQTWFNDPYGLMSDTIEGIDKDKLGYRLDGYDADYKPYGAIVAPQENIQNPYLWDTYSLANSMDYSRQPLYWEPPMLSLPKPYQPRMGQPIKPASLKLLFAKSYRAWTWVSDNTDSKAENLAAAGSYREIEKLTNLVDYGNFVWGLPTTYCNDAYSDWFKNTYIKNGYARNVNDREPFPYYCLIRPEIIPSQIKMNGKANALITLKRFEPLRLDFLIRIDRDQLPLTSYSVDWGDGLQNITSVAGVKLRDRVNAEDPFTLYHLYSLTKVRSEAVNDQCSNTGFATDSASPCYYHYCKTDGPCEVKVKITATDNWRATATTITQVITINQ